jgi:hypothetical protein
MIAVPNIAYLVSDVQTITHRTFPSFNVLKSIHGQKDIVVAVPTVDQRRNRRSSSGNEEYYGYAKYKEQYKT